MNQSELVSTIARATNLDQGSVSAVLNSLATVTQDAVAVGDRVQVAGLFIAEAGTRAARSGRNPRTGEAIEIPAHRVVKLTPAAALKRAVRG